MALSHSNGLITRRLGGESCATPTSLATSTIETTTPELSVRDTDVRGRIGKRRTILRVCGQAANLAVTARASGDVHSCPRVSLSVLSCPPIRRQNWSKKY